MKNDIGIIGRKIVDNNTREVAIYNLSNLNNLITWFSKIFFKSRRCKNYVKKN
jgi:hypothetical protein